MKFSIAPPILSKYPGAQIGYLVVNIDRQVASARVERLKLELPNKLASRGISLANFIEHPDIAVWRRIYRDDFKVKPSEYRSSVEALARRVLRGQGIWNISALVDTYCCLSVETMLPMGGYDLDTITGDIELRFGQEGENFMPLGAQTTIPVATNHVVYADQSRILCWLWNFKDCQETMITDWTNRYVFFIDAAVPPQTCPVDSAVRSLRDSLVELGAVEIAAGVADANKPTVTLVS